jgi:hypothetical protein
MTNAQSACHADTLNQTINNLDEALFAAQGYVEILSLIRDENFELLKRSPSADAFFSAKEALKRFLIDADTYSSQLRNDLETGGPL